MDLDKYWVASLFVHFPSNSISPRKAVLAAVAAALLLLASASSAHAELPSAPEVPAVPSVQAAAAPVEAAAESVEAVTTPVEKSAAPNKPSPATTETAQVSKVVDKATAVVDEVVQTSSSGHTATEEQATSPSPSPALDTVAGAIAERSTRVVKEAAKDPVGTGRKLIEPIGKVVTKLTAPIVDLPVLEDPSQLGGLLAQKQGSVSTTAAPSTAILTGDFTSLHAVAAPTSPTETGPADLLTQTFGGVASMGRSGSSLAGLPAGLDPERRVAALAFGEPSWGSVANAEQPRDRVPLDLPLPAAPSPFGAASPGSTFIPFVALLALLALVAPATLRRFREVAAFRAPTPFVCALERPG